VVIPDGGHFLPTQKPDRVASEIARFIDELSSARATLAP
jgi:hypothetical protein